MFSPMSLLPSSAKEVGRLSRGRLVLVLGDTGSIPLGVIGSHLSPPLFDLLLPAVSLSLSIIANKMLFPYSSSTSSMPILSPLNPRN